MNLNRETQSVDSVRDQFNLDQKIAVITGGGGFLGRYFALAVGEMGAYPILLDIDVDGLESVVAALQAKGIKSEFHVVNVCVGDQVESVMQILEQSLPRIDILINAAAFAMKSLEKGGEEFFASFEDYPEELWRLSIEGNLNGIFNITKAVGTVMKREMSGVIVNIASDIAVISPDHRIYEPDEKSDYPGVNFNTPASYPVAKAGVLSLTRYLATHWARYGIRVNSISPAGVFRDHDPKFVEQLAYRIPLGRMANPEELMAPIVFLSSDASSFMTGANLVIDGGRTIW